MGACSPVLFSLPVLTRLLGIVLCCLLKQVLWRRWDDGCCEDDDWKVAADFEALEFGDLQPFYHVLVDVGDWPLTSSTPPIAYVPQERLLAPQVCLPGFILLNFRVPHKYLHICTGHPDALQWPSTWASEKGADLFEHPMKTVLFLGEDDNGDLIPTRALRDKHGQSRQDVYPPDE